MSELPEDIEAIVQEVIHEEEVVVTEAEIEAALAEPVFAGIVARAMHPRARLLTKKGAAILRRTLAIAFLTDPHMAALLAAARKDPTRLRSGAVTEGAGESTRRARRVPR